MPPTLRRSSQDQSPHLETEAIPLITKSILNLIINYTLQPLMR